MFELTLELNQKCNLMCKYCYMDEKNKQSMSLDIAKKSIDFALEKVKLQQEKIVVINFLGGEPLLDYPLIVLIVAHCETFKEVRFRYTLSTNGLLLDDEIVDFLIQHDFVVKMSWDGRKEVHDTNRIFHSGEGSYALLNKKVPLINRYQLEAKRCIQITSVFNRNTITHYFDTLKYLTSVKGVRYISTTLDTTEQWKQEDIELIEDELKKSFAYFLEAYKSGNPFYWKNAFQFLKGLSKKKKSICGAGKNFMYVCNNGEIYTCGLGVANHAPIGKIDSGVYTEKMSSIYQKCKESSQKCNTCSHSEYCSERSCLFFKMDELTCVLAKLYKNIYEEKKQDFEQLIREFSL